MDALKYQLQLALDEVKRTREEKEAVQKDLADMTSNCHNLQQRVEFLERKNKLLQGIARGNLNLEYIAEVAPAVFEQVAHNLDRQSIFSMLRTNRFLRGRIQGMINAKKVENRIIPFHDTTVTISKALWSLGFNNIHFYGYLTKANIERKTDIVQMKRPMGKDGSKEMKIQDLMKCLKGFAPKKIKFDLDIISMFIDKHLHFLNQIEVAPGTPTEIIRGTDFNIPLICATTKPKELVLVKPDIVTENEQDFFTDECFKDVQHLCIRELSSHLFNAARFNIDPLSDQLMSFEYTGRISEYPSDQINILLKKWTLGNNPLKEVRIVTDSVEVEQVLHRVLSDIRTTAVSKLTQLPDFMQKKIAKDLIGLDRNTADINYRLLLSIPKRQMGCLYYSNSIAPSEYNHVNRAQSYLGFHAFDYFPVK